MRLIDTHAHLDEESFDGDLTEVLGRARAAGVEAVLSLGTTFESSRRMVELAHRHPDLYAAVGVHPNYTAPATEGDWQGVCELARDARVLCDAGFRLERVLPVDQFLWSPHVELAAVFSR